MKLKLTIAINLLFAVLSIAQVQAQATNLSGEITGNLLDENRKAFPYASVSLLNAKDSTTIKGTLSA
ncbi:MAG: hypothetical protein EOO89_21890, partial [Pedobacter sp.]